MFLSSSLLCHIFILPYLATVVAVPTRHLAAHLARPHLKCNEIRVTSGFPAKNISKYLEKYFTCAAPLPLVLVLMGAGGLCLWPAACLEATAGTGAGTGC